MVFTGRIREAASPTKSAYGLWVCRISMRRSSSSRTRARAERTRGLCRPHGIFATSRPRAPAASTNGASDPSGFAKQARCGSKREPSSRPSQLSTAVSIPP